VLLLKLDPLGNEVWNVQFGGEESDAGYGIVKLDDEGFAIVGYTRLGEDSDSDVWLIRTDANGNLEWAETYGGSENDVGVSLGRTSDGGYVVTGETRSLGDVDIWLIKTNNTGEVEWQRTYGGAEDDYASSVIQTTDGGYILTGMTSSFGNSAGDLWVVKTDLTGEIEWDRIMCGSLLAYGSSVIQTEDGGYCVVGGKRSVTDEGDGYLVKMDPDGNDEWTHTYNYSYSDRTASVIQTVEGDYVVSGTTLFGNGAQDIWVFRVDSYGNLVWNHTYGGAENEIGGLVRQTNDGGFVVTGRTMSFGNGFFDLWVIKTDHNGFTVPFE